MLKTNKEFTFNGKKYIQVYKENFNMKEEHPCEGCSGYIYHASHDPELSGKICDEANKHEDCLKNDLGLIWVEEQNVSN